MWKKKEDEIHLAFYTSFRHTPFARSIVGMPMGMAISRLDKYTCVSRRDTRSAKTMEGVVLIPSVLKPREKEP